MWKKFVRWFSPATRAQRAWHIGVTALILIVLLVLVGDGLYGLFTNLNQANAQRAHAQLDAALTDAATRAHVPPGLLQPIRAQEQQVATTTDGSLAGYQHATTQYNHLRAQVTALVTMPAAQARALAQKDLGALQTAVTTLAAAPYAAAEVPGYQARLQQAQASFAAAQTTPDYFQVAGVVQDQLAAASAYKPTYDRLRQFTGLVATAEHLLDQITGAKAPAPLLCANGYGNHPSYYWNTYDSLMSYPVGQPGVKPVEAQWLAQDQARFHTAATAADYTQLNTVLTGQIAQVQATNAALVPSSAARSLEDFKSDIQVLQDYQSSIPAIKKTFTNYHSAAPAMKSFASDLTTFQKQYDQDAQLLSNQSYGNYSKAVQQIQKHRDQMQFQVIYAKTFLDIRTLGDLVAKGQALQTHNPADGQNYPNAYEYADMKTGIGDLINADPANPGRIFNAQTTEDFQYADLEAQMFITNIQAMLTNLNDPLTQQEMHDKSKGWNQVHQTDNQLLQHYGIMQGKVIVVSLREQAARMYDNGKLVTAYQVTTGAMDLPSVPGIHCTLDKEYDTIFKSPDKPGDPQYYEPTHVNYAMIYHLYGYEIHDAWWRTEFGLYTNLPHHDPAAFNGGSHGCVNVATTNMAWIMNWLQDQAHTPLLIY